MNANEVVDNAVNEGIIETPRKMNDFSKVEIRDGRIYGLTLNYHFQVKVSESDNPSICPKVDCDGMPVEMLCKKAWEAMKVSGRPSMKKLSADKLIEKYNNEDISWKVMVSQEAANSWLSMDDMSNNQLDAEIARLQALRNRE